MSKGTKGQWKATDGFQVGQEGKAEANERQAQAEPLVQGATNFDRDPTRTTFPAIYGVDLKTRAKENLKSQIAKGSAGGAGAGALGDMLGQRQVMLDNETTDWLLQEVNRVELMKFDQYFEKCAREAGYFGTPQGLEYLKKIRPEYFKKRRKLAKWIANAQLKIFDLEMNGIQSDKDLQFSYMLQSLDNAQVQILKSPVHLLYQANTYDSTDTVTAYRPGIFARPQVPGDADRAPWAGLGTTNSTGGNTGLGGFAQGQGDVAGFNWPSFTSTSLF